MTRSDENRWLAGLILVAVGLAFFFLQRWQGAGGPTFILILGATFLVAYLVRRAYGLLVPAGILLGLGLGGLLHSRYLDDATLFGLGCGFLFIYAVSWVLEKKAHWWPLIPGAILVLIGFNDMRTAADFLAAYWPLALVAIGLLLLLGVFGGSGAPRKRG